MQPITQLHKQLEILEALAEAPMTQTQLVQETGRVQASVSRSIKDLIKLGLVEQVGTRRAPSTGYRHKVFSITTLGEDAIPDLEMRRKKNQDRKPKTPDLP